MMNNIFHNAAVVLLAAGLITGRSQYKPAAPPTPTPAPTTAPAAAPPSGAQAAADDSFCRWSVKLYGVLSAGGGEGKN